MAPSDTNGASVADEAARLAEAFAGWAGRNHFTASTSGDDELAVVDGAGGAAQPSCDCAHGPGVEAVCRNCPVCRAAGLIQAVSPELLDRAADLLELLASGLHSAAAGRRAPDDQQ